MANSSDSGAVGTVVSSVGGSSAGASTSSTPAAATPASAPASTPTRAPQPGDAAQQQADDAARTSASAATPLNIRTGAAQDAIDADMVRRGLTPVGPGAATIVGPRSGGNS